MPFKGYRTTSPFGWRNHPITGKRSFHTGIDIVKSHKAPIEAFTAGKVLFAGMGKTGTGFGGYGNVVLIKDKYNRGQVYAHLDSVSVKTGQVISKGQVIGRQGTTGQSTGSHLHFEVRKKAESKVPYGWVADRANNCLEPTKYLRDFKHATVKSDSTIKSIQNTLNKEYGFKIAMDGIFGPETKKALIKAHQTELNKQFNKGLVVDGIFGPKTKAASVNVRKGARGKLTWILQAMLVINGYDIAVDGVYGNETEKALRSYQNSHGLIVDAVAGKATFSKLFA